MLAWVRQVSMLAWVRQVSMLAWVRQVSMHGLDSMLAWLDRFPC